MVAFIDRQRERYGVEPMCAVLPIAPATYFRHKRCQADPDQRSQRAQRDAWLTTQIQRVWDENFGVYGARKVWRQLMRENIAVARCTVERLMQQMGLQGTVRGRTFKTTIAQDGAVRPADLVNREFVATRPNELWVAGEFNSRRRNTSMIDVLQCREVLHGKRRRSDRAGRPAMRSPGRPPATGRAEQQRFWKAIARGLSSEDAAMWRVAARGWSVVP